MTIYFLGGGNMTAAIVTGLVKNRDFSVHVVNRGAEKREQLAKQFQVATSAVLPPLTAQDVLVLAVKPQDMAAACEGLDAGGALLVSVAAGLSIDTLSGYLGASRRIVRAMPNTPAQIGLGITGLYADPSVNQADCDIVENIFSAVGEVMWLPEEGRLHAITGVSGSGPAYIFYLLNALQQAAQTQGFNQEDAHRLSLATFKGAVALAEQSGESFDVLQQNVTSKGGTTHEAIKTFQRHDIAQVISEGVAACVHRSVEMSQQFN